MGVSRTGRLIKSRRLLRGWTQQELHGVSGVDQRAISRLETGRTTPDGVGAPVLRSLASALGIDAEELMIVAASDLAGYDIDPAIIRAAIALRKVPAKRRSEIIAAIHEAAGDAPEEPE